MHLVCLSFFHFTSVCCPLPSHQPIIIIIAKNCWKKFQCCESTHRSATLEDRFLTRMLEKIVPFLMYIKHFLKKLLTLGFFQVKKRKMKKKTKQTKKPLLLKIQFSVVLGCDCEYLCHIFFCIFSQILQLTSPLISKMSSAGTIESGKAPKVRLTFSISNKRET